MKSVKQNDLLVIIFNNRDLNSSNLYNNLENLYDESVKHNRILMDLSDIRQLSDEAKGSLIYLQRSLKDSKKSLRFYGNREKLYEVYQQLNMEKVMTMAYTTEEQKNNENMVFYVD